MKKARETSTALDPGLNQLTEVVIGAAIEVHRQLGPGLPEKVYEEALCIELALRRIAFERQPTVDVQYKGHPVGAGRLDLLIDGRLIVELKAVEALAPVHTAQVITYLKIMNLSLGLLVNFNVPLLKEGLKRIRV